MAIEPRETHLPRDAGGPSSSARHGDASGTFIDDHLDSVYAFIARRIEDRSVAEDLTAATLKRVILIAQSGGLEPAGAGALALRLAASAVVDHARLARETSQNGSGARPFDVGVSQADAEALSDDAVTRVFAAAIDGNLLRRAVLDLPEPHRRVIVLAYFDALPPDEVGAVLGCSGAEVALRLHRALRALRARMNGAPTDAH